jgi:hypothetical protein
MGIFGLTDLVQSAGLTQAINECWWLLAGVSLLALPLLWWLGPVESAKALKSRRTPPLTTPSPLRD